MSDEYSDEITRNGIYQEDPRRLTHPRTKTREISPWFGRGSTAKAADTQPIGGATRRFSTRGPVSSSRSCLCL